MKLHLTTPLIAALFAVCVIATTGHAQGSKKAAAKPPAMAPTETGAIATTAGDPADADSTAVPAADTVHKKHGGLFGKVKGVAKNKLVQQVAKVAACTMVPGGQLVAGAIDAAASKSVAGAAQGAVGAASGNSCMPGMGGAAGMAGAGMAGAGMAGAGGASLGLPAAQLAAMQAGRGGERGAGTAEQQAMMVAQMAQMQQMQAMMAPQMSAAGGATTEAPGQTVGLSPDPAAELAKGKTVVRNIDWIGGMPRVSPAGTPAFDQAMARLAAAMAQAGASYRVDLYLDRRYDDAVVKSLGAARLAAVQAALATGLPAGQPAPVVEPGKTKTDKDPRLEIVRRK